MMRCLFGPHSLHYASTAATTAANGWSTIKRLTRRWTEIGVRFTPLLLMLLQVLGLVVELLDMLRRDISQLRISAVRIRRRFGFEIECLALSIVDAWIPISHTATATHCPLFLTG